MTITDATEKYYKELDMNCAEAVLHGLSDALGLGLRDEDYKLLGAFGAGCGAGSICGAAAAGVAVIGLLNIEERAHMSDVSKKSGAFIREVQKRYNSELCRELRRQFHTAEERCWPTVSRVTAVLDDMRSELFGI